jgi:hypothetical protein
MAELNPKVTTSGGPIDPKPLMDDDLNSAVTISAPENGGPAWVQYEFARPFNARAMTIAARGGIRLPIRCACRRSSTPPPSPPLPARETSRSRRTLARLPKSGWQN